MAHHAPAPATTGESSLDLLDAYTDLVRVTKGMDDPFLSYFAETYVAVADGTALPVRADHLRPGMHVIAASRLENRTIDLVTPQKVATTACISVCWTKRSKDDYFPGGALYPADFFLVVTLDSLDEVFGCTTPREGADA